MENEKPVLVPAARVARNDLALILNGSEPMVRFTGMSPDIEISVAEKVPRTSKSSEVAPFRSTPSAFAATPGRLAMPARFHFRLSSAVFTPPKAISRFVLLGMLVQAKPLTWHSPTQRRSRRSHLSSALR